MANKNSPNQAIAKTDGSKVKEENQSLRKQIHDNYGWYMLAHEVSKYTNTSFFAIMETRAIEIAGLAVLIEAHSEYNRLA